MYVVYMHQKEIEKGVINSIWRYKMAFDDIQNCFVLINFANENFTFTSFPFYCNHEIYIYCPIWNQRRVPTERSLFCRYMKFWRVLPLLNMPLTTWVTWIIKFSESYLTWETTECTHWRVSEEGNEFNREVPSGSRTWILAVSLKIIKFYYPRLFHY